MITAKMVFNVVITVTLGILVVDSLTGWTVFPVPREGYIPTSGFLAIICVVACVSRVVQELEFDKWD